MTKSTSSLRTFALVVFLAVVAGGCGGDPAQPWHYWLALVMLASALLVLCVIMPINYFLKVWRLKHRGR